VNFTVVTFAKTNKGGREYCSFTGTENRKMKKRFFVTILALTALVLLTLLRTQPAKSIQATITVPDDYATIQAAINASNPGDTVFVKAGIYYEHLTVGKSVSLVGESVFDTVISGGSGGGSVVHIVSDGVNLTGLTLSNSQVGQEGIRLDNSSHCSIFGNCVFDNWYGILLRNSSFCNITGNNMTNNVDGIHLEFLSHNNSIARNRISAAAFFGIHLISSFNNSIVENSASEYSYGIYLDASTHNVLTQNNVTNNKHGLYIDGSSDNTIVANTIVGNKLDGVFLYGHSNNNTFYINNFAGNTQQIGSYGGPRNLWDNGSRGNYWSDFSSRYPNSTEIDSSGVWNTVYVIDANNTDNYPLMNYFIIPEFLPATLTLTCILACFTLVIVYQRRRSTHAGEAKNQYSD
jgi:parallel beta-helix repeat protein